MCVDRERDEIEGPSNTILRIWKDRLFPFVDPILVPEEAQRLPKPRNRSGHFISSFGARIEDAGGKYMGCPRIFHPSQDASVTIALFALYGQTGVS